MEKLKFYMVWVLIMSTLVSFKLTAQVTSNDVYSRIQAIENSIRNISDKKSVRIENIRLVKTRPLHVYAIATALNEKIIILNLTERSDKVLRPTFPFKNISPSDVLDLLKIVEKNLKIFNPDIQFFRKTFEGKQSEDVLRMLIRCNLLIDNILNKKVFPQHTYQIVKQINDVLINANTNEKRNVIPLTYPFYENANPHDVFINAKNMFNTLMSSAHLKYNVQYPKRPYYNPYDDEEIKPIHIFTMTIMNRVLLQDYIYRNGFKSFINTEITLVDNITPAHAYQEYDKALYLLRSYLSQ